jgi:ADP-ribose pyrophosphatase YjhB (NUDIX family)
MLDKNSHCSFCGEVFQDGAPWPRKCTACANSSYLNPIPVVVVMVPVAGGIVVIRRNTEPQKGTLTLPGGYLNLGETWQEGGARELLEETGIDLAGGGIRLYDVMNGLDGTLVVFGLAEEQPVDCLKPFTSEETQEVVLIDGPTELGFLMHTDVVGRYFAEKRRGFGCVK